MSDLISHVHEESTCIRLEAELTWIVADAAHIMAMIVIVRWAVVGAILRSGGLGCGTRGYEESGDREIG